MNSNQPGFLTRQITDKKSAIGKQVSDTASNIQQVADQLRRDSMTEGAAEIADLAASTANRIASYLQETDVDTMFHDAEKFSRQRPWTVAVGGFLVGLGASRVLKAGAARRVYQASSVAAA